MVEYLVLVYKQAIDKFQESFRSEQTMMWLLYVVIGIVVIYFLVSRSR